MTIPPRRGTRRRSRSPRADEDALEVDPEHPVPLLFHELVGGLLDEDPRVVEQHVDPAESVDDLGDHPRGVRLLRDVPADERDLVTFGLRPLDRLAAPALRDVGDDDPSALTKEREGRREADSGPAARDEGRLPLETHGIPRTPGTEGKGYSLSGPGGAANAMTLRGCGPASGGGTRSRRNA